MRTRHRRPGTHCRALCRIGLVVPLLLTLLAVRPARAAHETIVIDGDLTDLIQAVNDNLGAGTGGFMAADPAGDIYTSTCAYVNGYDIRQIYTFIDFTDGMGNPTPMDVTLYAGWVVEGLIGDVDGDGNPNTFSPGSPGGSTNCALSDEPGIGPNESYNLLLDLDCVGAVDDIRIAVKNNVVGIVQGANILPLPGAEFAFQGSMLEVKIPNYQNILPTLNIHADLCNAKIRQTANAEFDGPGEDFVSPPFQLEVSPSIAIRKTPPVQEVCAGQDPTWTITVINDGLCMIDDLIITDTLQVGMTFVSSDSASTGDDQVRVWQFMGVGLAPLDSVVITLTARLETPCPGDTLWNRVTVEAVHNSTCRTTPTGAIANSSAQVICVEPCGDLVTDTTPLAACPGDTVYVPFTFTSCSDRPQSVTWFAVCGTDTIEGTTLGVPTNGQVGIEVPCILPIECVGSIDLTVYAELSVDNFEGCTLPLEATRTIRCFDPCLTIIPVEDKVRACAGAEVSASFWVYNCTTLDTLDLALTPFAGDLTGVSSTTIPAFLAPGDSVLITVTANMPAECFQGDFDLGLSGTGTIRGADCGDQATASTGVNCVEVCLTVEFNRGPFSACAGDTFDVVFDVRNCSTTDSADVDLTGFCDAMGAISVSPETVRLGPGEQIEVTVTCAMPAECAGPVIAKLSAEASVVGLEGPGCVVTRESTHTVNCVDVCLAVVAPPDTAVCAGDTVTVSFDVTNCNVTRMAGNEINGAVGGQSYVITATCNGVPVEAFPSQFVLGPGGTQKVDVQCVLPDACAGDIVVDFKAVAQFTDGPACPDSATAQATVRCVEACAELYCPVGMDPKACVGDTVSVPFRAKNCNTSGLAEIFSVTPNVVGATFLDVTPAVPQVVAAGDSVDYVVRVVMPAECGGEISVTLDLSAALEDDRLCATTAMLTKNIDCVEPCIDVIASADPIVVCVPDSGTAVFTVKNCSLEIEVVEFVALCHGQPATAVPASTVLQPGDSIEVTVTCFLETCASPTAPHIVSLTANAHVEGDPDCKTSDSDTKTILCTTPCLDVIADNAPAVICAGDTLSATWDIANCNTQYATDVEWEVRLPDGTVVTSGMVTIPAGDTAEDIKVEYAVPDTTTGVVELELFARGILVGFECAAEDSAGHTIDSLKPCIEIESAPAVACAGDTVSVDFYLTNCGLDTEAVDVTFSTAQGVLLTPGTEIVLQPGQTDTVTALVILPAECGGNFDVTLDADVFVSLPGVAPVLLCPIEDSETATVRCIDACALVYCPDNQMELAACAGDTVDVVFWVKNCNTEQDLAQNFTFLGLCDDMQVVPTPANALIGPGDSLMVTVRCVMPDVCDGPLSVALSATGSLVMDPECTASSRLEKQVRCVQPCLDVVALEAPLVVCAPDTARAGFNIVNCSTETMVVDLTGYCDDMLVAVDPAQVVLAPGADSVVYVVCFVDSCTAAAPRMARLDAVGYVQGSKTCTAEASDTKVIDCTTPCLVASVVNAPATVCAGDTAFVTFNLENCNPTYSETVYYAADCDGAEVLSSSVVIGPNGNQQVLVACFVPDTCSTAITVRLIGTAQVDGFGELCAVSDTASATIDCLMPCIEITPPEPIQACAGSERVAVPFLLENCGNVAVDYGCVFYCNDEPINGDGAINVRLLPGESDTLYAYCSLPADCAGDLDVRMEVFAFAVDPATGESLRACDVADTASAVIECVEACVTAELTPGYGPYSGCAGDTVSVFFTVKNCGADAESLAYVATCNGMPVDVIDALEYLEAGDSVVVSVACVLPEACEGPLNVSLTVSASIPGLEGEGCLDTATITENVACVEPCLLVAAPSDSLFGCAGDTIDVVFKVTNCNPAQLNEEFVFTATCNGDPIVLPVSGGIFAPGDHYITVPCVLPVDCSGDVEVVLEVTATVEGYKGCSTTAQASKVIGCAEGCVLVESCQERITACAGSEVLVPFVVKNCTENTEELITVSAFCDDKPIQLAQTEYVVAPGDSVVIEVPCTMPDWCMGAVNVRLVAEARKNGDVEGACPARAEAVCPVYCVEACVSACARFEGPVCPGDSLCVPFEVMNCNEYETEVFMFKYKIGSGPIQTLDLVLELGPGEIDTVCVPVKAPMDCPEGGFKVILEPIVHIKGLPDCKTKGYAEIIIECAEACLTVEGPEEPLRGCPGDTLEVPFTVTNCSDVTLAVNMNAAVHGELVDTVDPWNFYLEPGESIVSTVTAIVPEECPPNGYLAVVNSAWAMSANGMGCMIDVADEVRIYCNDCETGGDCGPLAIKAPPGVIGCPGDSLDFVFTVENQGEAPVDIYLTSGNPDWTLEDTVLLGVGPGAPVPVTAAGFAPEDFNEAKQVELCAVSYPAGSNPQEAAPCDTAKVIVNVTAKKILVAVHKTANPDTVTALNSTSRITIVVSSFLESGPLGPVTVTDYMPGGIVYAGNLESTCGVTTTAVPGDTCVMFSPFNLKPGTSCVISFDVTCLADGAWVDTAIVVAYCAGSETSFREVRDTARIVCKEARTACPRTIGFWRQQTEQKTNGSRKICEVDAADAMDMHRLWRQVIDMTNVTAFKANSDSDNSSMITTLSLRALSDDELFDALGCQLQGPTPMTKRDMAELQYLALLLNVKAGILPLDIDVDNDAFEGTIQEAIDAVEAILNNPAATTGQLTTAIDISDKINNRLGLMAQTCVGGENAPFNGFAASCPDDNEGFVCPGDDAPDYVGGQDAPVANRPTIVAYPNPFNPTAVLRFTVPLSQLGQTAVVEVFDATGRPVERLFEGTVTSEVYEILLAPDNWASGLYIARLTVGGESVNYRMMLVK
jgi:uncharacterized repeat protein (TIGR01451 family)